jgi:hypothetical protein
MPTELSGTQSLSGRASGAISMLFASCWNATESMRTYEIKLARQLLILLESVNYSKLLAAWRNTPKAECIASEAGVNEFVETRVKWYYDELFTFVTFFGTMVKLSLVQPFAILFL